MRTVSPVRTWISEGSKRMASPIETAIVRVAFDATPARPKGSASPDSPWAQAPVAATAIMRPAATPAMRMAALFVCMEGPTLDQTACGLPSRSRSRRRRLAEARKAHGRPDENRPYRPDLRHERRGRFAAPFRLRRRDVFLLQRPLPEEVFRRALEVCGPRPSEKARSHGSRCRSRGDLHLPDAP